MFSQTLKRLPKKRLTTPSRTFFSSPRPSLHPRDIHPTKKDYIPTSYLKEMWMTWVIPFHTRKYAQSLVSIVKLTPFDTRGQAPFTRSQIVPRLNVALRPMGYGAVQGSPGFSQRSMWPWYLYRSIVRDASVLRPKYHGIYALNLTWCPHRLAQRTRFFFFLLIMSFASDFHVLSRGTYRDPLFTSAITSPNISAIQNDNKIKEGLGKSTVHQSTAFLWNHKAAVHLALSTDNEKGCQKSIKEFIQNQNDLIGTLLFRFYRTPVTEIIRAALHNVQSKVSSGGLFFSKFSNISFSDPGTYSLEQILRYNTQSHASDHSPQNLKSNVKHVADDIQNHLDPLTYEFLLMNELTTLLATRQGIENMIKSHNATAIKSNPSGPGANVSNFQFVPFSNYPDWQNLHYQSDQAFLDKISQFFHQTPIGHLTQITSPDMQLALKEGVKYPAVALEYASIRTNLKSVLQDLLPPQGHLQLGNFMKNPHFSPNAVIAAQQLVPQDLLQLYPLIMDDTTSLPLNQALLLIDMSMGQLLGEYYRVSGRLPPPSQTSSMALNSTPQGSQQQQMVVQPQGSLPVNPNSVQLQEAPLQVNQTPLQVNQPQLTQPFAQPQYGQLTQQSFAAPQYGVPQYAQPQQPLQQPQQPITHNTSIFDTTNIKK